MDVFHDRLIICRQGPAHYQGATHTLPDATTTISNVLSILTRKSFWIVGCSAMSDFRLQPSPLTSAPLNDYDPCFDGEGFVAT